MSADAPVVPMAGLGASVVSATRRCVLWLGGEPAADLHAAIGGRGWRLRPVTPDALTADGLLREARALVVEASDAAVEAGDSRAFAAFVVPLVDQALFSGVPVIMVPADGDASITLDPERVKRFCDVVAPATGGDLRVTYCMREWGRVAAWIAEREPGPVASSMLQLDGDLPTDQEAEATALLRRAFHDAERVTLTRLAGGKSGAAVWSATPHPIAGADAQHRASPFLVKYAVLAKTRHELSRYAQYADERVSFRLRPPLHRARCVEGKDNGLLVFDFIERAVPFRAALTTYAPAQLIGSLFGHTLDGCLRYSHEVTEPLAPAFERIKVLNWSEDLTSAVTAACTRHSDLPDAAALRAVVESLRPIRHRVATAHGDLHTGNLLVAAGSSDVLLIDFGSIEFGMPVVTDAACLEVSITFAPEEARAELTGRTAPTADAAWLRLAYQYPLEPFAVPQRYGRGAWVADAVRAIRGVVRQHEPSTATFAVAVASYLIRYASYADNGVLEDRALAYEIASRLVLAVRTELDATAASSPGGAAESSTAAG